MREINLYWKTWSEEVDPKICAFCKDNIDSIKINSEEVISKFMYWIYVTLGDILGQFYILKRF